jgi:hypothetical protein
VDRFDTWLNAQRGWRLLLVRCLAFAPFGLCLGNLWSDLVTVDPPATPQVRVMAARMALSVAASFLVTALTLVPPAWRAGARRPGRASPTWRLTAALYSFGGAFVAWAYEAAEPSAWRDHYNGRVFLLAFPLISIFLAMSLWNARHKVSPADSPGWSPDGGSRES